MPTGKKVRTAPPPPVARCDFCGSNFKPRNWNSRTCPLCSGGGMPDQSSPGYDAALAQYLRARHPSKRRTRKRKV